MKRGEAQRRIRLVVNSGILSELLEQELAEVADAIGCDGEGFEGAGDEAVYAGGEMCESCPRREGCPDAGWLLGPEGDVVRVDGSRHYRSRRSARRHRACLDKRRFRSEAAAMDAGTRYGLDWYRCPYCHGWHLTSKNGVIGDDGHGHEFPGWPQGDAGGERG